MQCLGQVLKWSLTGGGHLQEVVPMRELTVHAYTLLL